MVAARDFSAALPRSRASWLDWISNMSLMAAVSRNLPSPG